MSAYETIILIVLGIGVVSLVAFTLNSKSEKNKEIDRFLSHFKR